MLEKLTQVVLIVSSVAIASVVISQRSSGISPPFAKGDRFPSVAVHLADGSKIEPKPSNGALAVFFSSTCRYCVASLPAYRELAAERCGLDIWVIFVDIKGDEMREWWEENGMAGDSICANVLVGSLDGSAVDLGVSVTPSHYLLGSDSRVVFQKIGQLETAQDIPQHEE